MIPIKITQGDHTATIYELKNKDFTSYCICWRQNGERMRRTKSNLDEAKAEAERIVKDLSIGDGSLAKISLKELQYYQQCEQLLAGVPMHVAVQSYLQSHGKENAVKTTPIRTVIHELLNFTRRDKSERHLNTLRYHLNPLIGDCPISKISVKELERHLAEPEWSNRTRQNHIVSFRILFNFAKRKHYLPDGVTEADKIENIASKPVTPVIYTPDELCALLNAVPPNGIPFIALGAFAGVRAQEILRLDWEDIDLLRAHIKLSRDKTKTNRRRIVPIFRNLTEWLNTAPGKTGPVVPVFSPYRSFTEPASKKSGIPWKQNALRHSFVSYHLAMEQNAAKTAMISGHTPKEAEESYLELVTKEDAIKWFSIFPSCKDGITTAYYRNE